MRNDARTSTPTEIPPADRFVKCRPQNGATVFRLYRIGESSDILMLAVFFLAFAIIAGRAGILVLTEGRTGANFLFAVVFIAFALLMGVPGVLCLHRSLRCAYTYEALLWDPSTRCLRWIQKTPFSSRSDMLRKEEIAGVRVVITQIPGEDTADPPSYFAQVSILSRRPYGEWLKVVADCDPASARELAEELGRLTESPVNVQGQELTDRRENLRETVDIGTSQADNPPSIMSDHVRCQRCDLPLPARRNAWVIAGYCSWKCSALHQRGHARF